MIPGESKRRPFTRSLQDDVAYRLSFIHLQPSVTRRKGINYTSEAHTGGRWVVNFRVILFEELYVTELLLSVITLVFESDDSGTVDTQLSHQ